MATNHTGNQQPSIDAEEHDFKNINVKKTGLFGYLVDTDEYVRLSAVESTDNPGSYGLLVLNWDGSSVSTGAAAVDNLLMETGDQLLLETGDAIQLE